ncbi:MAG: hypothetical protein ACJAUP_001844 [Cellvibrionaceae bacterium]|jgi:hypothetical protein
MCEQYGKNHVALSTAEKFPYEHNACLSGFYIMVYRVNKFYAYEYFSTELMQNISHEESREPPLPSRPLIK